MARSSIRTVALVGAGFFAVTSLTAFFGTWRFRSAAGGLDTFVYVPLFDPIEAQQLDWYYKYSRIWWRLAGWLAEKTVGFQSAELLLAVASITLGSLAVFLLFLRTDWLLAVIAPSVVLLPEVSGTAGWLYHDTLGLPLLAVTLAVVGAAIRNPSLTWTTATLGFLVVVQGFTTTLFLLPTVIALLFLVVMRWNKSTSISRLVQRDNSYWLFRIPIGLASFAVGLLGALVASSVAAVTMKGDVLFWRPLFKMAVSQGTDDTAAATWYDPITFSQVTWMMVPSFVVFATLCAALWPRLRTWAFACSRSGNPIAVLPMLVVTSVGTTVAWWFIYVSGRESVDSPYLSSGVVFVGILGLIALLTAMVLCASDGDVRPLPRERDLVLSTLACFAVAAACFLFFGGDPFSAQRLLDHSAFLSGSAAVLVVVCLLAIAVFILRRVQGRAAVACIALLVPSLFLVEQGTPGSDALAGCVSEQALNGNRAVYLAGEYVQSTGAGALIVRNGRDVAVINNCTTNWRLQDLGASIAVYGSVPVFGDSLSEPAAGQVDKVVVVGPSPRAVTRTVGGGYRASAPERVVGGIWMAVQER